LHVACGTGTLPTASVKIISKDQTTQAAACGDGPVDAAYEAIRLATGLLPKLENYSIRAVTSGKEALLHRPRHLDRYHRGECKGVR